MNNESLSFIFLNAAVVNNFVLALFLGICPFLGVSAKKETAWNMGLATLFVMLVSSSAAYGINQVLDAFDLQYLRLICYIAVIASAVQLVEMFVKKFSPTLFRALGIFLPLITTNCAILGLALFQTAKEYDFLHSLVYALGPGTDADGGPAREAGTGPAALRESGRGHEPDAGGAAVSRLHGIRRPGGQPWLSICWPAPSSSPCSTVGSACRTCTGASPDATRNWARFVTRAAAVAAVAAAAAAPADDRQA
jgi:electron transport complex protein RnfA